jgi:hypothetical protein
MIVLVFYLTSGYGRISSQSYRYARSLYTLCNQKNAKQLENVAGMIQADYKAQKLTDRDFKYLMGLVRLAKDGNWIDAQKAILALLEAQVQTQ